MHCKHNYKKKIAVKLTRDTHQLKISQCDIFYIFLKLAVFYYFILNAYGLELQKGNLCTISRPKTHKCKIYGHICFFTTFSRVGKSPLPRKQCHIAGRR